MMRLYVPELQAVSGAVVNLSKEQIHHIKVRRLSIGDAIALFNEVCGEWSGVLESSGRVLLQKQIRQIQPIRDIWLLQPLLSKDRFAFVTEKATELGITALYPLVTRYTQGSELNMERTRQHIIEAVQQSERLSVPLLAPVQNLTTLLRQWNGERKIYAALERSDNLSARDVFTKDLSPAAILVGPEGGFSVEEKEMLSSHQHVIPFSLGSNVLRSETAALAALAIFQSC